ncbi:MAG: hypothetical protein LUC24_07110 [Bacteroidales bacterium]|nr:hypothetical protein [Bacteroidales bacterium]
MKAACKILLAALMLPAVISCGEPASVETFVKSSMRQADGSYLFNIDMSDTTGTYDLLLYTRLDCSPTQFEAFPDPTFVMNFTSPSGRKYGETFGVYKSEYSRREYFAIDYNFPYRSDYQPSEYGLWQLRVSVPKESEIPGFLGVGLKVTRKNR